MSVIVGNLGWMFVNLMLAVMGVYAGWAYLAAKEWLAKVFFGLLWLLFVPNTIYILTDIKHIPRQVSMTGGVDTLLLLIQYAVLLIAGILTFLLALLPIEQALKKNRGLSGIASSIIVVLNFLIALGVAMGRYQRTNSWYIISDTGRVVSDMVATLTSPGLLLYIIAFGLICNALYFLFRGPTLLAFTVLKLDHKRKRRR